MAFQAVMPGGLCLAHPYAHATIWLVGWLVVGNQPTKNTATYGAKQLHNQEEHFLDAVQHWALSLLS
jgi:hypothetical protein